MDSKNTEKHAIPSHCVEHMHAPCSGRTVDAAMCVMNSLPVVSISSYAPPAHRRASGAASGGALGRSAPPRAARARAPRPPLFLSPLHGKIASFSYPPYAPATSVRLRRRRRRCRRRPASGSCRRHQGRRHQEHRHRRWSCRLHQRFRHRRWTLRTAVRSHSRPHLPHYLHLRLRRCLRRWSRCR
jgi:hypothetical protein